ncbi:MAG: DNA polymerase Y family protein [Akkermansiaceae bacterium]
MYASLHFPDLSLHCLLADGEISPSMPVALLSDGEQEKANILALNPAAKACGVTHGMSTLSAMARCPDLYLLNRDLELEKSASNALLTFAESLTPDFESTNGETIILDLSTIITASTRDWTHSTLEKATSLRLPVHLATDETPDLAHLRSLSSLTSTTLTPPSHIRFPEKSASLHSLNIEHSSRTSAFPILRSQKEILQLWGIHHLGDLSALPRQGLSERLGTQLAQLHDILHGKKNRLLKLHRPPTDYAAHHDFESPLNHFEPILFIARRLLQTLCNRLRNQQRAATALKLILRYENQTSHRKILTLSETTLNPEILLRSLHTYLDTLSALAPVIEFSLHIFPALPAHKQHEIFSKGLRDPHRFADTLHRLSSLVGADRIGIPQIQDTHHPDSFQLHPVTPDFQKPESKKILPPGNLPMSRLRPPVTVSVMSEKKGRFHQPVAILTGPHRGTILKTAGPYPISGNWWDRTWQQIQWDIQLPELLLQLTHTPPETWQLTGIYS